MTLLSLINLDLKTKMNEKPLNFRQKSSLKFVNQSDPPFIKQLKAKIGYCEPATISDKVIYIFFKKKIFYLSLQQTLKMN